MRKFIGKYDVFSACAMCYCVVEWKNTVTDEIDGDCMYGERY